MSTYEISWIIPQIIEIRDLPYYEAQRKFEDTAEFPYPSLQEIELDNEDIDYGNICHQLWKEDNDDYWWYVEHGKLPAPEYDYDF